ncbi:MAG: cytochrome c oxidase subunit I [Bacteroidota bacterium]|nr:cytochrome c oxidase subunit I [Bacteroidota bacterium]
MFPGITNNGLAKNTSYKVVLPFYVYAGLSFLVATIFLLFSSSAFLQHYFHPRTLAITHLMALGWGTMMILGASHQLVPVLIEGKLYSNVLAHLSFGFSGIGIPLLVYSFCEFDFGWPAQSGAILINLSVLFYLINMGISMSKSKVESVHAIFVFTATLWLFITTLVGLFLIYNFTYTILSQDSLSYLPLHAHLGIIGWFLLLVIGVGSRLILLFLISKYNNTKLLWWIYSLINIALISFIIIFLYIKINWLYLIPLIPLAASLVMFGYYCYQSYRNRIRKKVDEQVRLSLLSVLMMALPLMFLLIIILFLIFSKSNYHLIITYGFAIFFGWITAIIFGMTFKTLPFIVWNKVYHHKAGLGKTPNPKELFSGKMFYWMSISYLAGFVLFVTGVLVSKEFIIQIAGILLLITAVLYNSNLWKTLMHKPATHE